MITLIVDFDPDIGLWYFAVKEDCMVLHFRHGFRDQDTAYRTGDTWIREHLDATPDD